MDEQLKQQVIERIGPDVIRRMLTRLMPKLQAGGIKPEHLQPIVQMLQETMNNPELYPQVVQSLVQAGIMKPDSMPAEFEPTIVAFLMLVLTEAIKILQQQNTAMPANFAKGGLTTVARELQKMGRGGDTMLAHINPAEAAMLRRAGGSGTINPVTGLPEFGFFSFIGDAFKAVGDFVSDAVDTVKDVVQSLGPIAPIIAAVIAPYAIPALAGTLGIGSLAAGALYGAGTSALMGGNPITGAITGGLGAGLGDIVGGAVSDWTGMGLSPSSQTLLGNSLVGGFAGAATGKGFLPGAINAAGGTLLGNTISGLAGSAGGTGLGEALTSGGQMVGRLSAAGLPLQQALLGGALSGGLSAFLGGSSTSPLDRTTQVSSDVDTQISRIEKLLQDPSVPDTAKQAYSDYLNNLQASKTTLSGYQNTLSTPAQNVLPSDQAEYQRVSDLMTKPGTGAYDTTRGIYQDLGVAPGTSQAGLGSTDLGFNKSTLLATAAVAAPLLMSSLSGAQTPEQVQQAIKTSNPEYFEKLKLTSWDWNDLSNKAAAANMPLGTYVATNWNTLTEGSKYTSPTPVAKARGGALSKIAYLAQGSGSGRADTIDARLSDGEYVLDAETVAMLGDGSTRAGATRLDQMRSKIRQHKGKALSRGKISPNAKSPLAYLKGAA